MTKDEIVLIKQWDSIGQLAQSNGKEFDIQGEDCTFSFHSAFKDPNCSSTAPDRISIEVRLIAFRISLCISHISFIKKKYFHDDMHTGLYNIQ